MKPLSVMILIAVTCFTGCGYNFGNRAPGGIRTVSVGKVDVSTVTGEPRLAQWTAEKVRNAIATDNTLAMVDSADADARLQISVAKLRSVAAGKARLRSDDPDQRLYTTSIWRAEVTLGYRLVPAGADPATVPPRSVTGSAEYGDLIDITVMRQDAVRQALINASRKLVREMLDTW